MICEVKNYSKIKKKSQKQTKQGSNINVKFGNFLFLQINFYLIGKKWDLIQNNFEFHAL